MLYHSSAVGHDAICAGEGETHDATASPAQKGPKTFFFTPSILAPNTIHKGR